MTTAQRRVFTIHTSQAKIDAARKRDLGYIHRGKKALAWSEEDYRFHLVNLTGKSSAGELDTNGRAKVLCHMATLGFNPTARTFKPFDQSAKIKWLWSKIGEAGGLRDSSPRALLIFVSNAIGTEIADVSFLPTAPASKIIEALKSMLDRAKRTKSGDV